MIDVSPLVDMGLVILMATTGIVLTWLAKKLNDWFGLEFNKKHREVLQGTLVLAINSEMSKIRNRQGGKLYVENKETIGYDVISYLSTTIPDALKRFGIDPNTVEGRLRINRMVEARLAGVPFDEKQENVIQMKPLPMPEKKK